MFEQCGVALVVLARLVDGQSSGGGGSNSTTYGSHDLNDDSYNIHDDFHDDEWY